MRRKLFEMYDKYMEKIADYLNDSSEHTDGVIKACSIELASNKDIYNRGI